MGNSFFHRKRRVQQRVQQLIQAVENNRIDEVRMLLTQGVDINADYHEITALHAASRKGYIGMVVELLKHDNLDVNFQNFCGQTALLIASSKGHTDIVVELLKDKRVDVNREDCFGCTALTCASEYGHAEIVFRLLNHHDKVDVNHRDKDGNTALSLASSKGHADIVVELLKHDKGRYEYDGNTVLLSAI